MHACQSHTHKTKKKNVEKKKTTKEIGVKPPVRLYKTAKMGAGRRAEKIKPILVEALLILEYP